MNFTLRERLKFAFLNTNDRDIECWAWLSLAVSLIFLAIYLAVYSENNPVGDNFVDFGLYADNLSYSDYVNGYDSAILLDFNVDGNVLDLM